MSKRPGEELDQGDLQKKLKASADLPTTTATAGKISYAKLKPPTSSTSSSSSISYASLKKQQVSSMLPGSTQRTQQVNLQQRLQHPPVAAKPIPTSSETEAQAKTSVTSSDVKTESTSAVPSTSTAPQAQSGNASTPISTAVPQSPNLTPQQIAAINLKNQQKQIMLRAQQLKEEEMQVRLLKKEAAVRSAVENTKSGYSGSGGVPTLQQKLQIQNQQKAKEQLKQKEKQPLTKQEIEMENLKRFAAKKALEEKKIEKIMEKVKKGDIVLEEHKRNFDQDIEIDVKGKDYRVDGEGNFVDSKGNKVVIEAKQPTLKVNKQKKQEEKLRKVMRQARLQNTQIFQDGSLFLTTATKRDRKKVHALNFIEDTKDITKIGNDDLEMEIEENDNDKNAIVEKKKQSAKEKLIPEGEEGNEDGSSDDDDDDSKSGSGSGSSSGDEDNEQVEKNSDFRSLMLKTETDYRREEFQKSNSRYLSKLLHKKKQSLKQKHHDPIPDVEWWDMPLFEQNRRYYLPLPEATTVASQNNATPAVTTEGGNAESEINVTLNIMDNLEHIKQHLIRLNEADFKYTTEFYRSEKINNLIEHPKPFRNEGLPNQNAVVVIPNYMTAEERKKLRRRHRLEKEREKQDKMKLGLIPPPPPKIRLKNMMRVLGNEAVADPTKMEALVRKGIADRLEQHMKRNEENTLTKEQKQEKALRKLKRDSSVECRLAVFRIENLTDRVHKFKVDINAQQMQLHGLLINPIANLEGRTDNTMPAIVLVEGGPKAIKFYKKLLLRRIKWDKNSYLPKDENGAFLPSTDLSENKCALVWEGVVKDHSFNKWRVIDTDNEVEAKRAFAEKNVEFYFDMALNYQYPD